MKPLSSWLRKPLFQTAALVFLGLLVGGLFLPGAGTLNSNQHNSSPSSTPTHRLDTDAAATANAQGSTAVVGPDQKDNSTVLPKATVQPLGGQHTLVFSPSQVVLPKDGGGVDVSISADNSASLFMPTVSPTYLGGGALYLIDFPPPPPGGGPVTQTTWTMHIHQIDYNSSNSLFLNFSSPGGQYTGKLKVSWGPTPDFYVTKGAVDEILTATTATYVMHYTLVTNQPYFTGFGNPTIYARIHTPNQYYGGPNDYCDGGIRQTSYAYSGQNEQTLTCVLNRPPVYVPGSGPPPPLQSPTGLNLEVYGMLGGEFIHGGTGEYPFGYVFGPAPTQTN